MCLASLTSVLLGMMASLCIGEFSVSFGALQWVANARTRGSTWKRLELATVVTPSPARTASSGFPAS